MNDQRLPYPHWPAALPGVTGNTGICQILGDLVGQMLRGVPEASHAKKRPHASA